MTFTNLVILKQTNLKQSQTLFYIICIKQSQTLLKYSSTFNDIRKPPSTMIFKTHAMRLRQMISEFGITRNHIVCIINSFSKL